MKGRVGLALCLLLFSVTFMAKGISVNAADPGRYQGPTLDPYCEIEAETNFFNTGYEVRESDGRRVVCLENGDYFRVKDVDFDRGMNEITITVKADEPAVVEMRRGSENGSVLGTVMVNGTKGNYAKFSADTSNIWGRNVVYFVCTYGTCSIDCWKADAVQEADKPSLIDPYRIIEAENMENAGYYTEGDTAYAAIGESRCIILRNVNFSMGVSGFEIVSQTRWPGAEMYIYIDEPKGTPVARVLIRSQRFYSCTGIVSSDITGVHDVYITSNHPVEFDSWKAIPGNLPY